MENTNPQQSASLASLAAAFAAAQGEFGTAGKDRQATVKSDKGSYSYKYANFASIMDAVREPLAKNKLAVTVRVKTDAKGATAVAMLLHASGEWMAGDPVTVATNASTPQATGSAIEYARKYAVRTLLNIATDEEDDDGAAAAGAHFQQAAGSKSAPRQQAAKTVTAPAKTQAELDAEAAARKAALEKEKAALRAPAESAESKVIAARAAALWKEAKEADVSKEEFANWCESVLGAKKPSKDWTSQDADMLQASLAELVQSKTSAKKEGDVPF